MQGNIDRVLVVLTELPRQIFIHGHDAKFPIRRGVPSFARAGIAIPHVRLGTGLVRVCESFHEVEKKESKKSTILFLLFLFLARVYKTDREKYTKLAREWTGKYAM